MRIRVQVAALEIASLTAAMVKLFPVVEQPEPGLFASDDAPVGNFAIQIRRDKINRFPIGKEFDLLFALPIHELPDENTDAELVEAAKQESRTLGATTPQAAPAPDHDVTADPTRTVP